MSWTTPPPEPVREEPISRAPLLALLLAASMPLLFFFQERLPDEGLRWAFYPIDLRDGRLGGLVTAMLLHGGWTHAIMNAVAALAFGTPLVRALSGWQGVVVFLTFYLVCGVVSTAGYGLLHVDSDQPMVGASGAIFGLIGATTRLTAGRGRVAPLTDRSVLTASAAWMAVNLVSGFVGLAGVEGVRIAWEAHAIGFVVGLLAVGPLIRLHRLA